MHLTHEQVQALEKGEPVKVIVGVTPCVIVREDLYREELDYSPLTKEEIDRLACHAANLIDDSLDEPL